MSLAAGKDKQQPTTAPLLRQNSTKSTKSTRRNPDNLKSANDIAKIMTSKIERSIEFLRELPSKYPQPIQCRIAEGLSCINDKHKLQTRVKKFEEKIISIGKYTSKIERMVDQMCRWKEEQQRGFVEQPTSNPTVKHPNGRTSEEEIDKLAKKKSPNFSSEGSCGSEAASLPKQSPQNVEEQHSNRNEKVNEPDKLLRQATHYQHLKNYSKARQSYSRLHKMKALPSEYMKKYADCLYELKQFKQASVIFEEIYRNINPTEEVGNQQICQMMEKRKVLVALVSCLKHEEPGSNRLLSFIRAGIDMFQKQNFLDPNERRQFARLYMDLAAVQQKNRDPPQAIIRSYQSSLKWDRTTKCLVRLAQICSYHKMYERVAQSYRAAIDMQTALNKPVDDKWRQNLIEALFELNRYQQAQQQFSSIDHPSPHTLRIKIRIEEFYGDDTEADLLKVKLRELQKQPRNCVILNSK